MDEIGRTILDLFRQKQNMKDIGEDEDFFDLGVSSLTIIELQIRVEEVLGITVPTSELMRLSTIRDWINVYAERSSELSVSS